MFISSKWVFQTFNGDWEVYIEPFFVETEKVGTRKRAKGEQCGNSK